MKKRILNNADYEGQKQKLSATLKALRREHKYNQQTIADRIGVERSTYTSYETERNLPNIFILDRIAKVYGITVDDILNQLDEAIKIQD